MTDKFKVGDVVILVKVKCYPELLGKELTITEPRQLIRDCYGNKWLGYGVDLYYDGDYRFPEEYQLKLKTFDGEQKVLDMFESLNVTKEKAEELI